MATSGDSGHDPTAVPADPLGGPSAEPPGEPVGAPPAARRGLGAVGRSLLLGVGLVAAFFAGLAAVMLLTGDDDADNADDVANVDGAGAQAPADAVQPPGLAGAADRPGELPGATLEGFADGPPVDTAAYRGEPLVVNFWATWCPPCVEEMPEFQAAHAELGDDVAFLGVNVNDAPSNAEAFVDELGVTYDLAVDVEGDYYRDVGSAGMPTTLAVDADGRIVGRHAGALSGAELRAWITEHLDVDA